MAKNNSYEEALDRKFARLEGWVSRIYKQMRAIQDEIIVLKGKETKTRPLSHKIEQIDMFGT